ncbi:MAG: hypothetical protein JXR95_06450 [Deltaproteobacteria bacterium]|nr:hypothetical protein [Deltaproteobacteria bacterium]
MRIVSPLHIPLTEDELGFRLSKVTSESTPEKLRVAFSKGLAPGFDQVSLLTGLYQLAVCYGELVDNVEKTIKGLPENSVLSAATGDIHPRVLDFLISYNFGKNLTETVINNKRTYGETISKIAKTANEKICCIIADNQERLFLHPPIIEALYLNRNTPMSVAGRIIELAVRNNLNLSLDAYDEMAKALEMDPPKEEDPIDAYLKDEELDQKFRAIEKELEETVEFEDESEKEKDAEKKVFMLSQLPISARIRLAQLGTKFHRAQLIRDSNKVVSMAVIKSPAITDAEVEEFSKNRQISEEIIRYICRRKDWLKSYRVKVNLVNNPKTPIPTAISLLSSLRMADIKSIARSRNIAQVVRQAAANRMRGNK